MAFRGRKSSRGDRSRGVSRAQRGGSGTCLLRELEKKLRQGHFASWCLRVVFPSFMPFPTSLQCNLPLSMYVDTRGEAHARTTTMKSAPLEESVSPIIKTERSPVSSLRGFGLRCCFGGGSAIGQPSSKWVSTKAIGTKFKSSNLCSFTNQITAATAHVVLSALSLNNQPPCTYQLSRPSDILFLHVT